MAITEFLTLFAAVVSAQASAAERSRPAHLGVAATVVRPVEVVAVSNGDVGTVSVVGSSGSVEVLADGGSVVHADEQSAERAADRPEA